MDAKCAQLLPSVCAVLADPGHPVADDTCLEKLLDWFKALASAGPSLLVLRENPCLIELILAVLKQGEPDPVLLSFILRLTGIFAASESSFQHLQQQEVVFGAFGEAGPLGSPLWEDMTIRSGWVGGCLRQRIGAREFSVLTKTDCPWSPAFSSHECSLWKLVALALKNISLAQPAGPPSPELGCFAPADGRHLASHFTSRSLPK
ncbi:BRCA1-associated ATM activator 1, partial [Ophiophagus hannah]